VYLSLVVPAWNGADRLAATLATLSSFLAEQPYASELVVVDDASGPATRAALDGAARRLPALTVIHNARNRGKGYSVSRGMLAARGRYRVFTDADLAYPAEEVAKILGRLEAGSDVAVACRVLPESRYMMSPSFFPYLFTRHVLSRAFNAVVRTTLLPGVLDTQAGLKGYTAAAAAVIFPRLTILGFGFDVEALYVARRHRFRVTQTAVSFRYDAEPSTVHFARDAVRLLLDLWRIAWNGLRRRYD
jgi:glycosyltransferase involved in cell wall biosynthesis